MCYQLDCLQRPGGLENQDADWVEAMIYLKGQVAEKEKLDARSG